MRAAYRSATARKSSHFFAPNAVYHGKIDTYFVGVANRRSLEDLVLGNPELDPTTSTNYDLLLEHYDQNIGVLSAGDVLYWLARADGHVPARSPRR